MTAGIESEEQTRETIIGEVATSSGVLEDMIQLGSQLERDLGLDSMDREELIIEFEDHYGDDGSFNLESPKTVGDIMQCVRNYLEHELENGG